MHNWHLLLLSYFPMAVTSQGTGLLWYNLNWQKGKVGQGPSIKTQF